MGIMFALLGQSLADPDREAFQPCRVVGLEGACAEAPDVQDSQEAVRALNRNAEKSPDPGVPENGVEDGEFVDVVQDNWATLRGDLSRKAGSKVNVGPVHSLSASCRRISSVSMRDHTCSILSARKRLAGCP